MADPAEADYEGVERDQAAHGEQRVDRAGGVEEGAPQRTHREDETRRQERDRRGKGERAQSGQTARPRQGQQADDANRERRDHEHVEQVVGSARDAEVQKRCGALGEVAGEGRRVLVGEDVEVVHR